MFGYLLIVLDIFVAIPFFIAAQKIIKASFYDPTSNVIEKL